MTTFKREPRYIVFKIKDLEAYCSEQTREAAMSIGDIIANGRRRNGKAPFNALVVEQDWPEFEPTWAAIELRCRPTTEPTGPHAGCVLWVRELKGELVQLQGQYEGCMLNLGDADAKARRYHKALEAIPCQLAPVKCRDIEDRALWCPRCLALNPPTK